MYKIKWNKILNQQSISCLNVDTRLQTPILFSIRLYPNSILVDVIYQISFYNSTKSSGSG
jgi:hypothetical protein